MRNQLQGARWHIECDTAGPELVYEDRRGASVRMAMHGILRAYIALMLWRARRACRN